MTSLKITFVIIVIVAAVCLENEGIGGIAKVIKGDHFSEVNIQRGDRPNFTLFSQKNPPLPRR